MDKDRILFNQIFREHYSPCVYTAYAILKDQQTSEDLVQELFIDLWKKRDQLFAVETLQAYLKRAIQYKCFDVIRKKKKNPTHSDNFDLPPATLTDSPEDDLLSKERLQYIRQCIDKLPEKGRAIFLMSRQDKMSYQEIAETLKISTKTVEYHMMQNLKTLRKAIFALLSLIYLLT